MKGFFTSKISSHNLRRGKLLKLPPDIGNNSWLFRGVLLWNNLPKSIKEEMIANQFKNYLKNINFTANVKFVDKQYLEEFS